MSENITKIITEVCQANNNDRTRLMNIVEAVQAALGCVNDQAMDLIAKTIKIPRVEVASVVSFYSFLSDVLSLLFNAVNH